MSGTEDGRVCVDRVFPPRHQAKAKAIAIHENRANDPSGLPAEKLALQVGKRWALGKALRIAFLDGTATVQEKVIRAARPWTDHANIRFDFGHDEGAEIRISFRASPNSWSALGTDALVEEWFPRNAPTMSLGWLRDATPDEEVSRVVLHEFGHALGAIHEHQNPAPGIKWNKAKVYEHFAGPPNYWSVEQIDANLLARYAASTTQFSAFDPTSIMIYRIPAWLTEDGNGIEAASTLSATDIGFIKEQYPR